MVRLRYRIRRDDLLVDLSLGVFEKFKYNLDTLSWGIFDNQTSVGFILPRNCFYVVRAVKIPIIAMPIAPKVCLGLFDEEYCKKYPAFTKERIVSIQDNETVIDMNSKALQYEMVINGKFAVASNIEDLKDAWDRNKDKKEQLKKLREQLINN